MLSAKSTKSSAGLVPDSKIAEECDKFVKKFIDAFDEENNKCPDAILNEFKGYEKNKPALAEKIVEKCPLLKRINVFIKKISGGSIICSALPLDKSMVLFEEVRIKQGLSHEEQTLMYAGKVLSKDEEDKDNTLVLYGIHDGSTVYLVLRLRGGMEKQKNKDEYECCVCLDKITKKEIAISCPSSHVMCATARDQYMKEVVIKNLEQTFPPRCPQCGQAYGIDVTLSLVEKLPKKTREDFEVKAIYYHTIFAAMKEGDRRVKCPKCDYFEIHTKTASNDYLACKNELCKFKSCIYCAKDSTENHSLCGKLGFIKIELEEAIDNATYKRCPTCKVGGQKDGACSHMTCLCCKTEYCYVCMKTKKEIGGDFSKHFGNGKDLPKCPQWLHHVTGFGEGEDAVLRYHSNLKLMYLKNVFDKYGEKAKQADAYYGILKNNGYELSEIMAAPKSPFEIILAI